MPPYVYSKRFGGPTLLTTTASTVLFTVPAGRVYVVRTVTLLNISTTATTLARLSLGPAVGEARIYKRTMEIEEAFYADLRFPMTEGETGRASSSVANAVVVSFSGYDFAA